MIPLHILEFIKINLSEDLIEQTFIVQIEDNFGSFFKNMSLH